MSFAVATYVITLGSLGVYGLHLVRERNKLRNLLSQQQKSNPG